MTFRLGLTGSIGMGKSTTAGFFTEAGIPVWDADAAVHRLYRGAAVAPLQALFPSLTGHEIDRGQLRQIIAADPTALPRIEAVVHPLVWADRTDFLRKSVSDIAVFDIPLLFEKGTEAEMDATLLVTAPASLQRQRVLSRGTMSEADLARILARQMPDADKRRLATHIVETLDLASTRAYVQALIAHIRNRHA